MRLVTGMHGDVWRWKVFEHSEILLRQYVYVHPVRSDYNP
jgi:hypothetical protein